MVVLVLVVVVVVEEEEEEEVEVGMVAQIPPQTRSPKLQLEHIQLCISAFNPGRVSSVPV